MDQNGKYSLESYYSIYELGRMYYETGIFAPAERIFSGLSAVDNDSTPSRVALGLVKLELGFYQDASSHFRMCIEKSIYTSSAKIGLAICFIAMKDYKRAQSLLVEVIESSKKGLSKEQFKLLEALLIRTRELLKV